MEKCQANKNVEELIARRIGKVRNGIILEYHDHLTCDSWRIHIRKDGETIGHNIIEWDSRTHTTHTSDRPSLNDYIEVDLVQYSDYLMTPGVINALLHIKEEYPELPVYSLNAGWYTFPNRYMPCKGDSKYFSRYEKLKGMKTLHVNVLWDKLYDTKNKSICAL